MLEVSEGEAEVVAAVETVATFGRRWPVRRPAQAQVLPLMYLHGMSPRHFAPALEKFIGSARG